MSQIGYLGPLTRGHYIAALDAAREVAENTTYPVGIRIDALLACVRSATSLAMIRAAVSYADAAMRLATDAQDTERVAMVHHYAGLVATVAGDYQNAEHQLLCFLAIADVTGGAPLDRLQSNARYHLGKAMEGQRREDTAISLYLQAADLWIPMEEIEPAVDALHNAAWLQLRHDDPEMRRAGLVTMEHAGRWIDTMPARYAGDHKALRAVHLLMECDYAGAVTLAQEITAAGEEHSGHWARCCACWVAGEAAMAQQLPELANGCVECGLGYAQLARDPGLMNLLGALRGRIPLIIP